MAKNGCRDIDDCAASPCKYGGKCTDAGPNKFTCVCAKGWYGTTCVTKDPCAGKPCKNGGKCKVGVNSALNYKCECATGWTGTACGCKSTVCKQGKLGTAPLCGLMAFDGSSTWYDTGVKDLIKKTAGYTFSLVPWTYREDPTLNKNDVLDFANGVNIDNIYVF